MNHNKPGNFLYFQAIGHKKEANLGALWKNEVNNQQSTLPIVIYKQLEIDRVLIVLPIKDSNIVRKLAFKIHLLSQLYTENSQEEFYINCSIASIKFPQIFKQLKNLPIDII